MSLLITFDVLCVFMCVTTVNLSICQNYILTISKVQNVCSRVDLDFEGLKAKKCLSGHNRFRSLMLKYCTATQNMRRSDFTSHFIFHGDDHKVNSRNTDFTFTKKKLFAINVSLHIFK